MANPTPLPAYPGEPEQPAPHKSRALLIVVGVVAVVAVVICGVVAVNLSKGNAKPTAWPASLGGRPPGLGQVNQPAPKVTVTAAPGVYAWNDFDGFHLWVVHGAGVGTLKGTLTTDGAGQLVSLAVPGAGTSTTAANGRSTSFTLPATPHLVGLDFQPGFYTKKITIVLDGPNGPIATSLVATGHRPTPAQARPLVIEKVPVADAPKR